MVFKAEATFLKRKASIYKENTYYKCLFLTDDYETLELNTKEEQFQDVESNTPVDLTIEIISTKYGYRLNLVTYKTLK